MDLKPTPESVYYAPNLDLFITVNPDAGLLQIGAGIVIAGKLLDLIDWIEILGCERVGEL